jgi:hypothetical protein
MNPAPDAELASVGENNHNWIVNSMTEFILKKLSKKSETPEYSWLGMIKPTALKKTATKATATKATSKKATAK